MKHLQKILLLLVVVLATSCIKENLDDCETPVTIYFQYKADGNENVLPNYINKIDLYVFDETNSIISTEQYGQDELTDRTKGHVFRLKSGKYKLVAVGNAYDKTKVVHTDTQDYTKIFLQHPNWETEKKVNGHDDNYLGQQEIEIPEYKGNEQETIVQLYSSHIEVDVEIIGLTNHPGAVIDGKPAVKLRIEQSNAQTDFNNDINQEVKGTCYPELVYDASKGIIHTNDLKLFRMDHDGHLSEDCCSHILILTDTEGNELVRGNIYDYIQRYKENIDVTKQEAILPISIEFTSVGVDINLPKWVIVDGEPDWN